MKMLVFTEGTILMHENAGEHSREEIVQQVESDEESVARFSSYIPIGNAVEKIKKWREQGAEIAYVTSRTKSVEIRQIKSVLEKYGFPDGQLHFRKDSEVYKSIGERLLPDVLVEDDCESIGGATEMIWPNMSAEAKAKVKSVAVKEFEGIDNLPDEIREFYAH